MRKGENDRSKSESGESYNEGVIKVSTCKGASTQLQYLNKKQLKYKMRIYCQMGFEWFISCRP